MKTAIITLSLGIAIGYGLLLISMIKGLQTFSDDLTKVLETNRGQK